MGKASWRKRSNKLPYSGPGIMFDEAAQFSEECIELCRERLKWDRELDYMAKPEDIERAEVLLEVEKELENLTPERKAELGLEGGETILELARTTPMPTAEQVQGILGGTDASKKAKFILAIGGIMATMGKKAGSVPAKTEGFHPDFPDINTPYKYTEKELFISWGQYEEDGKFVGTICRPVVSDEPKGNNELEYAVDYESPVKFDTAEQAVDALAQRIWNVPVLVYVEEIDSFEYYYPHYEEHVPKYQASPIKQAEERRRVRAAKRHMNQIKTQAGQTVAHNRLQAYEARRRKHGQVEITTSIDPDRYDPLVDKKDTE